MDRAIDFDDVELDPLADSFDTKREHQKDILTSWHARHLKYPYFSEGTKRLLPTEASSGTIELDIGMGGQFLDSYPRKI